MKTISKIVAIVFLASACTIAQSLKTPQASTTQTIKQELGISSIELTYARPNMKGRTIFGDLVPFGKPWRTGANSATKITFADDVKIAGKDVKAGSYAIYTIPNVKEWEIIINKGIANWGINGYNEADDVVRFKVPALSTPNSMETFTMQITDVKSASANIMIWWDKTMVMFEVSMDVDNKIMASIDQAMNKDNRPYFSAATYYYENGKDMKKALEWATKAADASADAYWVWLLKARIQQKMGDKMASMETSKKSMEMARKAGNMDYVALNEKLQASLK